MFVEGTIQIVAHGEGDIWHALYSDPRVCDLFGSNILPTPYATTMPRDDAVAMIQGMNPQCRVY